MRSPCTYSSVNKTPAWMHSPCTYKQNAGMGAQPLYVQQCKQNAGMDAQPLYVQQWPFFFFFLVDFFTSGLFYLEISVKAANSRSYVPISILTEVLEIQFFTSGGLFEIKNYLTLVWMT